MDYTEIEDERLTLAVESARKGGETAESTKHQVERKLKDNNTIVTEADRNAEKAVREILENKSSYPILGEEYGGDIKTEDTYWVVDPIDGTNNFSHEQPLYGTGVALVENNEPTLGVIYMPEFDYLFYAADGEGAYRDGQEISVSSKGTREKLYCSMNGVGVETFTQGIYEACEWMQELKCAVATQAWVASGWTDVGVFGALAPWDMAPGVVLIREAGGIMENVKTGKRDWESIKNARVIMGPERLVNETRGSLPQETITSIINTEYNY